MTQTRRRTAAPRRPTTKPSDEAVAPAPSLRRQYADWPQPDDRRAQPWDLDALGIAKPDRELDAGAPDTISPIVIRHRCPTLTSGSAGPLVAELAARLQLLGYQTSISKAENPYAVLDHSVMAAVEAFRGDYGVQEDPTPYAGPQAAAIAAGQVGPYTWEALIRVSDRAKRELEDPAI